MMKKGLLAAAFACAALSMPAFALADDAMTGGAMKHDAPGASKMMATMVCRHAVANEKPTAMMMDQTKLVCKTITPAMMMKKGSGPDLSHALSADQVDAAWRAFLQQQVTIPGGTGGG
jgi:hypothetical protein